MLNAKWLGDKTFEHDHRKLGWIKAAGPSRFVCSPPYILAVYYVVMRTSGIDARHVTRDIAGVIKSFADRQTEELFRTGKAKRVPADVARRALRKLEAVHVAAQLADLRVPPGNRLHALRGDRAGQHAISVNDQWRICFRFADGDAFDVEFCDYH